MPNHAPLHHHRLIAWQRADDLFIKIHLTSLKFPAHEGYELGSQLRRASYSVVANIVEGFGRRTRRDRLHFLHIAPASLAEAGYCVHAASRLGYISQEARNELEVEIRKAASPLSGLIRAIDDPSSRSD
jgi:four helix bundle protein